MARPDVALRPLPLLAANHWHGLRSLRTELSAWWKSKMTVKGHTAVDSAVEFISRLIFLLSMVPCLQLGI